MVSFRRIVLAMALLALFVGLASAQVGAGGGSVGATLSCSATVTVPPILRSEGLTEQIGDIVIQCTGSNGLPALGAQIPTVNVTVSLATNVTSLLIGAGTAASPSNASEALLFIDDPGSGTPGPGAAFPPTVCSNSAVGAGAGGCVTFLGNAASPGNGTTLAACSAVNGAGACTGPVINVFQGLVSGNQVTFNGIPVLAPVTGGFQRTFRITNVRANVAGLGGGGLPGTSQLLASVAISPASSLPVGNPVQIAGFIQSGLTTSVANSGNSSSNTRTFQQCNNAGTSSTNGPASAAILTFRENFGTAFKTRVAANSTTNGSGIGASGPFNQGVPGVTYSSESGLIMTVNGATAGLATFGTRLKAVFSNIPAGVRIFVSTFNLASNNTPVANTATLTGASVVNNGASPAVAVLVPSETGTNFAGLAPPSSTFANLAGALLTELPVVNGSAIAVWEVVQASTSNLDLVQFGVLYTIVGNQSTNTPPAGSGQVNLSYAPTAGPSTFSATAGAAASASLPIPRFVDNSTASTIITIALCQTDLLFPFVTAINGFDTGLAIANTTTDPFGTTPQTGSCTMNFYGTSPPSPVNTGSVASGTVYTNVATTVAPGFQGYMIAVCNFQFAHGFAFVSDVGARNLAMGYLALVINNGSFSRAVPSAENLNN